MITDLSDKLKERKSALAAQLSIAETDNAKHQLMGAIGEIDNLLAILKDVPEIQKEEDIFLMKPTSADKTGLLDSIRSIFRE